MIPIEKLEVSAYTVPTDLPESDGTLEWESTTMVVVELYAGGHVGIGYSYASPAAAAVIRDPLAKAIVGKEDIPAAFAAMRAALRNVGISGIGSMALSAVDIALWDLKAKQLGASLAEVLGCSRPAVPAYGSGGFTSYSLAQLETQLAGWVGQGFAGVKMKVGRDPSADLRRVRHARAAIGPEADLMIDANGAYSPKLAIKLAGDFYDSSVTWFEEPVPCDDPAGLLAIRERVPMEVAAGEYGAEARDFLELLPVVDVLQADATRCQGVTGFLRAATLALGAKKALSSHCAPMIHAHLGASVGNFRHLEWFHDHVRIERLFFDGFIEPENGCLTPSRDRPGLGIELKRSDMQPFRVA